MGYRLRSIYFLIPLIVLLFVPTVLPAYESGLAENARSPIPPPSLKVSSWLLMDSRTGTVIASENQNKRVEPASLSKLMTAYVVFQEIQRGILGLDEEVTVSERAWKTVGSRMFIEPGDRVRVEDLLLGLIVQSGNDAAVALAEHVAGSEA
ncbi:MAG: serine hydrolase, partial [Pseudomonadota bacterium]